MTKEEEKEIKDLIDNKQYRYLRDLQDHFEPEDDDDLEFLKAIKWAVSTIQNQFALISVVKEMYPEIKDLEDIQKQSGSLDKASMARLNFTLIQGGKPNGTDN
jgi:hypothetical protein